MCMMLREGTIRKFCVWLEQQLYEMMHFLPLTFLVTSVRHIDHWFAPVQDTLEPLLEAYQVGLRTGDVENAANNREYIHPS